MKKTRPLSRRHRQSPKRSMWFFNPPSFPAVVCLLLASGPSAIVRRIRAIVVDSVDGQSGRTQTHVGEKIRKGVYPPFANKYSATAVVIVILVIWVQTTSLHARPNLVFGGFIHPGRGSLGSCLFTAKASAASNEAAPERRRSRNRGTTADTHTFPCCSSVEIGRPANNCESGKGNSVEIDKGVHF